MLLLIYSLVILIMLFLAVAYWSYRIAFYSSSKNREDIMSLPEGEQYKAAREAMGKLVQELKEIEFENVSISSFDGIELVGGYYHVDDDAPLQIQFHGYRGSGIRDFCGGNKIAREMGHNTLLVTQRAHGKSGGKTISFGINECRDCVSWIDYAINRFGNNLKIIISGVSMGAATVLKASAFNLPENVVGIIADSPYSSAEGIIKKVSRDMKFNAEIMYPFIKAGAKLFGKINLTDGDVKSAVAQSKLPILIIHGERDGFVPCDMSREIYEVSPVNIERVTFPGAGHGLSYIKDSTRYKAVVEHFVNRCINE